MMGAYHDPLPLFVVVSYDAGRTTPLYVTLSEWEAESFRTHFNYVRAEAGSKVRAAVLQGVGLYPCTTDGHVEEPAESAEGGVS